MLVDNENRARLADFGFAGVCVPFGVAGASNSSDVGGTAVYMAPELLIHQISKDRSSIPPLKKPVDVYALGMLIYEVIFRFLYSMVTRAQYPSRCSVGSGPFMVSTTMQSNFMLSVGIDLIDPHGRQFRITPSGIRWSCVGGKSRHRDQN